MKNKKSQIDFIEVSTERLYTKTFEFIIGHVPSKILHSEIRSAIASAVQFGRYYQKYPSKHKLK